MKCPHCSETVDDAVPRSRLNEKQTIIDRLEKQIEESTDSGAELAKVQKRLERIESERDLAKQELADFQAKATTRETLLTAGITDPDDQDLVLYRYGKLEEEGRPELSAYLETQAREDRILRGILPTLQAEGDGDTSETSGTDTASTQATQQQTRQRHDPNAGAARTTGPGPTIDTNWFRGKLADHSAGRISTEQLKEAKVAYENSLNKSA